MNARDDRVFIESAAIALGDVERGVLRFRRPRDNAADVIALVTINADA
jgi:hypothetical protein